MGKGSTSLLTRTRWPRPFSSWEGYIGSGHRTMLLLHLSLTVTQLTASPVLQPSSPPSSGQQGTLLPSSLPPSSPLPHAGVVWLVPSPVLSCAVPVPHVAWQSQQTSSPYLQEKEVATFHVHKNMWATKLTIAYVITEPLKHIWLLSNILQQLYYKSCSTNIHAATVVQTTWLISNLGHCYMCRQPLLHLVQIVSLCIASVIIAFKAATSSYSFWSQLVLTLKFMLRMCSSKPVCWPWVQPCLIN